MFSFDMPREEKRSEEQFVLFFVGYPQVAMACFPKSKTLMVVFMGGLSTTTGTGYPSSFVITYPAKNNEVSISLEVRDMGDSQLQENGSVGGQEIPLFISTLK